MNKMDRCLVEGKHYMIHIRGVKFKFAEGHTRIMVALKGPGGCGWVVMDSSMLLTLRGACGGGQARLGGGIWMAPAEE